MEERVKLKYDKMEDEEEFANFMRKVNQVDGIIRGMQSGDTAVAMTAVERADALLLGRQNSALLSCDEIDENELRTKEDRSLINKNPQPNDRGDSSSQTMSTEMFMKSVERDIEERRLDKEERKQRAETYKRQGNTAFRTGDFNKALNFFNKAIGEIKDSPLLYTNRALTYMRLGLHFRAISDCDTALKIQETNLRAHIYKAQCLHALGEQDNALQILTTATQHHPEQQHFIEECRSKLVQHEESDTKEETC